MATRTSRKVGWPTAAVIRRTWRLRPSRMVSRSQAVGTFLRNRIGTDRSGKRRRLGQQLDLGRTGRAVVQDDAPAQGLERLVIGDPLDLDQIRLGMLEPRVGEAMGQPAVVGQEQQALAVAVEPADRVDPRDRHERLERGPALGVAELAEDVVGLEQGDGAERI